MKIKIVGFNVGVSRPTANRTIDITGSLEATIGEAQFRKSGFRWRDMDNLGLAVAKVLAKSDFISIRRVKD
jgi:hypothetical protein